MDKLKSTDIWTKKIGNLWSCDSESLKYEICVNKKMIKKVKEFEDIDDMKKINVSNNDGKKYIYYHVYNICDKIEDKYFLGYTSLSLESVLHVELFNHLNEKGNNKIDKLIEDEVDIYNVKIKSLGLYRAESNISVKAELNKIKQIFFNEIQKGTYNFDPQKYLKSLIEENNDTDGQEYHIQKIFSKTKKEDYYIYGGFNKLHNSEIINYINKNCIYFHDDKIRIEDIKSISVECETQGKLAVDLMNNNKNGKSILIGTDEEIKKRLFMMFECENMQKEPYKDGEHDDSVSGDYCYVACIIHNNKKFIFSGEGKIVNKMKEFYTMTYHNDIYYSELIKVISTVPWSEIILRPLKFDIPHNEIESEKNIFINKHNKDELLNYFNVEECATVKDIKEIKNMIYASKYKK
jgi:hypothetical protein